MSSTLFQLHHHFPPRPSRSQHEMLSAPAISRDITLLMASLLVIMITPFYVGGWLLQWNNRASLADMFLSPKPEGRDVAYFYRQPSTWRRLMSALLWRIGCIINIIFRAFSGGFAIIISARRGKRVFAVMSMQLLIDNGHNHLIYCRIYLINYLLPPSENISNLRRFQGLRW